MLTISKQSDYGILLLSYVNQKKTLVSLSDLVKETKLPKRFLARIAATLVKENMLQSFEGKKGGYKITDKVKKVSVYDFLKIFNDDFSLCGCETEGKRCRYQKICNHKNLSIKISKIVVDELKKTKLLQFID